MGETSPIALNDRFFGEQTAQSCVNGWLHQQEDWVKAALRATMFPASHVGGSEPRFGVRNVFSVNPRLEQCFFTYAQTRAGA